MRAATFEPVESIGKRANPRGVARFCLAFVVFLEGD